jgi:6-phosphogluconolactonase
MSRRITEHDNFETLVTTVVERIDRVAHDSLACDGAANFALAGGSTPLPVYQRLSRLHLDWSAITVVPTDERWVAPDHPDNNLARIRRCLHGTDVDAVSLLPDSLTGQPSADAASARLRRRPEPFAASIIGMGADGHFASLFPHNEGLAVGLDPSAAQPALVVTPDPLPEDAPHVRVSLTLSRLLNSRHCVVLIQGEAKRRTLELAREDDANTRDLPIAALLRHAGERLEIHWSP